MTDGKLCQFIVKSFIEPVDKKAWPREMKIAKKLIIDYKEDFWIKIDKTFKIPSLAWFLTPKGKAFLINNVNLINLNLPEKQIETLSDQKVAEDKEFKPDVKTLMEFLKK